MKWGVPGGGVLVRRKWVVGRNELATTSLVSALISASASKLPPVRNAKTRDVRLQQGGYLCPRCDGFNLCFESIVMVD